MIQNIKYAYFCDTYIFKMNHGDQFYCHQPICPSACLSICLSILLFVCRSVLLFCQSLSGDGIYLGKRRILSITYDSSKIKLRIFLICFKPLMSTIDNIEKPKTTRLLWGGVIRKSELISKYMYLTSVPRHTYHFLEQTDPQTDRCVCVCLLQDRY